MILYEIDGLKLAVNVLWEWKQHKTHCGFKALNILMLSLKFISEWHLCAPDLAPTSCPGSEGRGQARCPGVSRSATARLSLSPKEGGVAEGGPCVFTTFIGPEGLADKCHFNKNLFKKRKKTICRQSNHKICPIGLWHLFSKVSKEYGSVVINTVQSFFTVMSLM